jgi:Protein of unknown function (DUF2530)
MRGPLGTATGATGGGDFPADRPVRVASSGDSVPHHPGLSGAPQPRPASQPLIVPIVPAPAHPSPPPLQVDTVRVVQAGMVLWSVALVVLLVLGDRVDRVWTWTCVAAIALAVLGLGIMRWQGQLDRDRPPRHE